MSTATKTRPKATKAKPTTKTSKTKVQAKEAKAPAQSTIAQVIESSRWLVDELATYGVQAGIYSKPPDGRAVFSMGKATGIPGTILIWPGSETVQISFNGDASKRQAVMTVFEPKHVTPGTYTRAEVQLVAGKTASALVKEENARLKALVSASLRGYYNGASVPSSSTYSVGATKVTKEYSKPGFKNYDGTRALDIKYVNLTTVVNATVPMSTQYFLVGHDESSQFICILPRKCTTVEDAHRALRPKGVPATALRQGEFFFVPATKKVAARIAAIQGTQKEFGRAPISRYASRREYHQLERQSTHRAERMIQVVEIADVVHVHEPTGPGRFSIADIGFNYVTGTIRDGRTGHHKNLVLDGWYRVVRNAEVQPTPTAHNTTRRYD